MAKLELPVVADNSTPAVCGPCGGECCKAMPGSYHPAQFGPDLEGVAELLAAGKASIDWWEGDQVKLRRDGGKVEYVTIERTGYFLRPAIKPSRRRGKPAFAFLAPEDGDGGVFDPTFGGECVNLGEAGCVLPFAARPLNCQAVVAVPDRDRDPDLGVFCKAPEEHNKPGLVIAWNPYASKLEKIGRRVQAEAAPRG